MRMVDAPKVEKLRTEEALEKAKKRAAKYRLDETVEFDYGS